MNFTYNGVYLPNSNFWKINWIATPNGHSVTEGGSSGSPLVNSNKRVLGQLFGFGLCPDPNCSNPSQDVGNYGKFSVSWTGNGATDSRRRLHDWLDPSGTAGNTLDGKAATLITGPSTLCTSDTYTVTNLPAGATVTWSAVPSNALTISGSGSSVTVTPTGSFSGQVTLKASISSAVCGHIVVEKIISEEIINITDVIVVSEYGQIGTLCRYSSNNYFEIFSNPPLSGVTYEVQIRHLPSLLTVYTTTTTYLITPLPANFISEGEFEIRVRVINHPCADGSWTSSRFECLDDCTSPWKVSPNPIDETLSISIEKDEVKEQTLQQIDASSFFVSLYNANNLSVAGGEGKDGQLTLETSSLPEGNYYLHIQTKDGATLEKRAVVIER